jgi:two-component system sensor histidine kinase AtoS
MKSDSHELTREQQTLAAMPKKTSQPSAKKPARVTRKDILSQIPTGIMVLDKKGKIRFINPSGARMLGLSEKQAVPGVALKKVRPEMETAVRSGDHELGREFQFMNKAGALNIIGFSSASVSDDEGHEFFLVSFREITPFKIQEDRRRMQEQTAIIASVMSELAHKLKNGVFGVSTLAYGIQQTESLETREALLSSLIVKCQEIEIQLKELLNQHALKASYEMAPLAADETLWEVAHALGNSAHFSTNIQDVPLILGDASRLKEAFQNVMVNAVQACGASGHVAVSCDYLPYSHEVEIIISDDGPGVPHDLREQVFLPFVSTKRTGSGMGLTICKQIISNHKGTIRILENKPKGCTIEIRIPVMDD